MNEYLQALQARWESGETAFPWHRVEIDGIPARVRQQAEAAQQHVAGCAVAALRQAMNVLARTLATGASVTVTEVRVVAEAVAWDAEAGYAELQAALTAPDYSHATHRPWCGRTMLCVYRADTASPTQCALAATGNLDDSRVQEILEKSGRRPGQAGTRGAAACIVGMTR